MDSREGKDFESQHRAIGEKTLTSTHIGNQTRQVLGLVAGPDAPRANSFYLGSNLHPQESKRIHKKT